MSPWSGSRPPRPIFFGLALITVGVLLLLRELGAVPDIGLWTLIWLALGSWLFLGTLAGNRRGWFWPLTLLLIGSFMLLRDLDVLEAEFSIWPVVIIALGLSMVLEASSWGKKKRTSQSWEIES
ncbi:MAG: hypothetical protein IH941_06945 [Acidobacteria bacterium]|nr:hypothetical protein [Acidobacteriota bacterium]